MATADSVKNKIQNLINDINNITGKQDTDLTNAVNTALADYGYSKGVQEGKQAEYDALWDNLQNYGKRVHLQRFLADTAFEHIDPKHFVKASNADNLMASSKAVTVNWSKFNLTEVSSLYSAFFLNYTCHPVR